MTDFINKLENSKHGIVIVQEAAKFIMAKNNCTMIDIINGVKNNDENLMAQFSKLVSMGLSLSEIIDPQNKEEL